MRGGLRVVLALALLAGARAAAEPPASGSSEPPAPAVVVLSFDGVRHDYLDREGLPALGRIAREGARAEALRPVFPSSTFPNHAALATGATSEVHGIVGNRFIDAERGLFDFGADASFLWAEPLWVTAERQGVRSATFFWVASETDWQGLGASDRETPFDGRVDERAKAARILAWLDRPAAERPRLVMSWWHGADSAGHRHGPDDPRTTAQLQDQDAALAELLAGLDARQAWPWLTLLVVSDHGMAAVDEVVDVGAALDAAGVQARVLTSGPVAQVYLEDRAQRAAAVAALDALEGVSAWPADAVPERLHDRVPHRNGDVLALADPPRVLTDGSMGAALRRLVAGGQGAHGFDPTRVPEMGGILLAMGRGVPAGLRLPVQRSIDVAPTVAALLGIAPPRDAQGEPIGALLRGLPAAAPAAPDWPSAPGASD